MATIGYATLQIIPSLDGVSKAIDKQIGGAAAKKRGQEFARSLAAGIGSDKSIEKATEAKSKAADKLADALGKVKVAQANLTQAEARGNIAGRARAVELLATAQRRVATETRNSTSATKELETATKRAATAAKNVGSGSGSGGVFGDVLFGSRGASGLSSMAGSAGGAAATALKGGIAGVLTVAAGALIMAPFIKGMQASFETGIDFDRVANTFSGVTSATTAQMNEMRATARGLGSDTQLAGVSASDAGRAMLELAKGGLTASQAMEAARGTLQLATAGQLDAAEAAKIQSAALNIFQLKASDATHVADLLAAAANASSADVSDLGMALQQGGSVAAGFGVSIEDTLTALTMFSRFGINGSDAGTMLKTSLQALTDQGKPAQEAIRELGLELYDQQGQFVGVESMMKQVAEASKHMSQEQFQAATNVLFGSDAMRASMIAANGGADAWDSSAEAVNRQGAAADMAKANMQGLPGIIEAVDNTFEGLKLAAYDAADGLAKAAGTEFLANMTNISDWMGSHKADMIGFFGDVGEAAAHTLGIMLAFGAGTTRALAGTVNAFGDTYGAATKMVSGINRLLGRDDIADSLLKDAEAAFGWGDSLYTVADGLDVAVNEARNFGNSIGDLAEKAQVSARFTDALGGSIAQIEGKDIVLKDNAPEVLAKIDKTKIAIETMPDGKFKIIPLTPEATQEMNAWRTQQGAEPINVPIAPKLDPAAAKAEFDRVFGPIMRGAAPGPPPNTAAPGTGIGGIMLPPPRAQGGIFDVWKSVASFANGKLPGQAMIQPPVSGAGLVQWAEPSTKGEAFIPLNGGERSKAIWMETGKRLGMMRSFAEGGLGDAGGLRPFTQQLRALITQTWGITDIGGYRSPDGYNEHSSGRALDVMIPNWQSPEGIAEGNRIAQWALSIPGVNRVMWQQSTIHPDGSSTPVADRGSPTANHMDHVHIFTNDMPVGSIPSSSMSIGTSGTGGYSSGGTAGYGPGGESGTYQVDQKDVRESEQRVADADAKVAIQEQQVRELKADAEASTRLREEDELRRAKREAQDARTDLAETKQGKFTPGSSSSDSSSSTGTSILSIPSAFSGLAGIGLDGLGLKTKVGPNTPERTFDLGGVASAAVGGQVSSLLGVAGVGDSPPFLQAASKLVSGISIGGGSAAPLSASPTGTGTMPPDDAGNMHGSRAGQQPGPTYNITARDTEDAFIRAQRLEREKSAAKLQRF